MNHTIKKPFLTHYYKETPGEQFYVEDLIWVVLILFQKLDRLFSEEIKQFPCVDSFGDFLVKNFSKKYNS